MIKAGWKDCSERAGWGVGVFDSKVWLFSLAVHRTELEYMMEVYRINWDSVVNNENEMELLEACWPNETIVSFF